MRALVQRVSSARVEVAGRVTGAIGPGLLVLLGVHQADTDADARWIAHKLLNLRVLPDAAGKMNESVLDQHQEILVVSQFTLYGDVRRGFRPAFTEAAGPEAGRACYEQVVALLAEGLGHPVPTGEFGAMMQVHLVNEGPVTLMLESPAR